MSRPMQNRVKCTVFDLFNIKYRNMFKRPDLLLEFKAFAFTVKKSIWRYVTTNRCRGVEVIMADAL